LAGGACIKGLLITVSMILIQLGSGHSINSLTEDRQGTNRQLARSRHKQIARAIVTVTATVQTPLEETTER
jgi:hypothetical protein